MDGDGLYPPSDAKLRKLREAGIVPISSNLLTAAACFGLLFFVLYSRSYAGPHLARLFGEAARGKEADFGTFIPAVIAMLLSGCAAVVLPVVLLSLIQSRFLFSIRRLRGRRSGGASFSGAVHEIFHTLLWFVLFGLVCLSLIRTFDRNGAVIGTEQFDAKVLNSAVTRGVLFFSDFSVRVLAFFSLAALFYGLLSWFVLVLWFRRSHRMTREELEAEYRETEMSPELRKALGERGL